MKARAIAAAAAAVLAGTLLAAPAAQATTPAATSRHHALPAADTAYAICLYKVLNCWKANGVGSQLTDPDSGWSNWAFTQDGTFDGAPVYELSDGNDNCAYGNNAGDVNLVTGPCNGNANEKFAYFYSGGTFQLYNLGQDGYAYVTGTVAGDKIRLGGTSGVQATWVLE